MDECVDRHFAETLSGHDVKTEPQMGWAALKNGELLARAEQEFDVFITVGRALPSQQNLAKRKIALHEGQNQSARRLRAFSAGRFCCITKLKPGQIILVG